MLPMELTCQKSIYAHSIPVTREFLVVFLFFHFLNIRFAAFRLYIIAEGGMSRKVNRFPFFVAILTNVMNAPTCFFFFLFPAILPEQSSETVCTIPRAWVQK